MKELKLSQQLKSKRKELDLSAEEMAGLLNIKWQMYRYYEKGRFDNTNNTVRRERLLKKLNLLTPEKENLIVTGELLVSGNLLQKMNSLEQRVTELEGMIKKLKSI